MNTMGNVALRGISHGETITRLSRVESFAVAVGAVGAQILTIGGLVSGVALIVLGYPSASIAAIIPAILGASAQVIQARRQHRD